MTGKELGKILCDEIGSTKVKVMANALLKTLRNQMREQYLPISPFVDEYCCLWLNHRNSQRSDINV